MANLVRNYSFEDDGFNTSSLKFPVSKWMTMGSNLGETSTLDPKLDGHAEYLAIGTVGSLGSVSQTFATVVGQKYTFQFSFSSDGAPGNRFVALWDGTAVMDVSNTAFNPGWSSFDGSATYTFTETAASTSTTISFEGQGSGSSYVGVDDVLVDHVPDILWQNSSGEVALWELNGTGVIGSASLGNPGPGWQVKATGDFNHSGGSDVLWQSDSGEVVIWETNGTSVIGSASLGNPGRAGMPLAPATSTTTATPTSCGRAPTVRLPSGK